MKISKLLPSILLSLISILSFIPGEVSGQSPNVQGAVTRVEVSGLQSRSERGQSNGYPPLGTYVAPLSGTPVVDPRYLFPSFAGSPDNTIWVKNGSVMAPLAGLSIADGNLTANNVQVGTVDTGIYGIKISSGSSPLFLRAGTGNKVFIDYNQSLGGSDVTRSVYTWSISPAGAFKLGAGEINGNVDHQGYVITELLSAAGTTLTVNFNTATITSSSGSITMAAPTGMGVIVPSTGSASNATFALNTTSATTIFGRKDLTNTWDEVQTFSEAPVVPNSSFSIAKVASLQTSLDAALKRDGTNTATGNLNIGGFRITNMGTPVSSSDSVTLGYLTSNYVANPVASLAIQAGTPLVLSGATGAVTISMPPASTGIPGFLTAADRLRFISASSADAWADGELMIGSTASSAGVKGTITAGDGISVTNGAGSITIAFAPNDIVGARPSSLLEAAVTGVNVNTTTPTSMYSYTVPANGLVAGDVVRIRLTGNFILQSGGQTIDVDFQVGGGSVINMDLPDGSFSPGVTETPYEMEVTIVIRTAGVSGVAAYSAFIDTPSGRVYKSGGTFTFNTTTTRLLDVIMTISAITGSNHVSAETAEVRLN